jgi:hypothetical protein
MSEADGYVAVVTVDLTGAAALASKNCIFDLQLMAAAVVFQLHSKFSRSVIDAQRGASITKGSYFGE